MFIMVSKYLYLGVDTKDGMEVAIKIVVGSIIVGES